MKLSDYCIKNRVISYALIIVLVSVGIFCFFKLSVKVVPRFHANQIFIRANDQGASPQFMQDAVTAKIEQIVHGTPGIDTVSSQSSAGQSSVDIQVQPNVDLDHLASVLQNHISMERNDIPRNVSGPYVHIVQDTNSNIIMFIGVYAKVANPALLTNYVNNHVVPKLNTIRGVGEVETGMDSFPNTSAVRVWLDPKKMAQFDITTDDILDKLNKANVQTSGGRIENADQAFILQISTKPANIAAMRDVVIRRISKDHVVHLGDVARVVLGEEDVSDVGFINNQPGFMLSVYPQEDANNLLVAKRLTAEIQAMQSKLPEGMHLKILLDRSRYISDATNEVYKAIILAIILVSIVVFLFLGSLRLFLIPIVIVPICLLTGFAIIYAFGFTINIMTLLAIVLSIGLVVDDAIVVLENVIRHFHQVKDKVISAQNGVREIAFPIIAMTCTLVAVYLPIVFLSGFLGDLIRPFAYTLATLVVLSGILSLTLTPTMCSQMISEGSLSNRYIRWLDFRLDKLHAVYENLLSHVLKHRLVVIALCLGFVAAGGYCFTKLPQELLPSEDYGLFTSMVSLQQNTSPAFMVRQVQKLTSIYQSMPAVQDVNGLSFYQQNAVFFMSFLKPPEYKSLR